MQDLRSPRRRYKTSSLRRFKAKHRRATQSPKLADGTRERCINENMQGTHGPPTHGCRCFACHETYKETCR